MAGHVEQPIGRGVHVPRVSRSLSAAALPAVKTRIYGRQATCRVTFYICLVADRPKSLPENADCCLADLLFVSTGVILPERELKFDGLVDDDLPKSNGVKPLLIVFPYKSSMLRSFEFHIWH